MPQRVSQHARLQLIIVKTRVSHLLVPETNESSSTVLCRSSHLSKKTAATATFHIRLLTVIIYIGSLRVVSAPLYSVAVLIIAILFLAGLPNTHCALFN